MAKDHGARRQKKLAKHKAKRAEKQSRLARRDSVDPNVRLRGAETWPIVHSLVAKDIWKDGIGHIVLARRGPDGRFVAGVYLVDVFCLGVKNAFWDVFSEDEFRDMIDYLEESQAMGPMPPAGLAKLIEGAVTYARSFGFAPHPDFRHASKLLEGIDPNSYAGEFQYGRDGKPFYVRGPHETLEEARVISERVREAGGHFFVPLQDPGGFDELDDDLDEEEDDPSLDGPDIFPMLPRS
jgi:hypothetical protein